MSEQTGNIDSSFVIPSESFTNKTIVDTQNKTIDSASGLFEYILSGFNNSDPIIRFCYWFILVCLIVFISINLFIVINRYVVAYYKSRKRNMYEELQELLTEYLYLDEDEESKKRGSEILKRVRKLNKQSKFYSNIIKEEILELHKQFKGDASEVLRKLYIDFNFDKKAIKKLKVDNWTMRSSAIRELAQMDIAEASTQIKLSLNHINPTLRLETGIALLKLDKQNPFALLDTDKELNKWQQINLLSAITTSKDLEIPSFKKWLNSKQPSIVVFSLIMIEYYQQLDAEEAIIELLDSNNEEVLLQAVKTLGVLESFSSEYKLIQLFAKSESIDVKLCIIEAISKIGSDDSLEFLYIQLKNANRDIALRAAYAIKAIGQKGVDFLHDRISVLSPDVLEYKIIKHSLDPYLSIR